MTDELKYPQVVRAISETPWAIMPGTLRTILEVVALRAKGHKFSEAELAARLEGRRGSSPATDRRSGIAVIPISGVIVPRANMFTEMSGGTSIEGLRNEFLSAIADRDVRAVLFDVNSPGGSVELVHELATDIRAGRDEKPVVAVANTLMASAAYHLASQATEVFATPTGDVGSIGVFAAHENWAKALEQEGVEVTLINAGEFKTEGNPYEPLGEAARGHIQSLVDASYEMMVGDISAARGITADAVKSDYGKGRVYDAARAQKAGLIDGVQTFEQTAKALMRSGDTGRADTVAPSATGQSFVDEAESARAAVAGVVTRLRSLRELERGTLTGAKRGQLEQLAGEVDTLVAAIDEALKATAPAEVEGDDDEGLEFETSVAEAEARLRIA